MTPGAVDLRPVDEATLERMIAAALGDASADEVTRPLVRDEERTPERIDWMRTLHRERRVGLDGPAGEATWAVVADGEVVGAAEADRRAGSATATVRAGRSRGWRATPSPLDE
ncbi:MAG TPA: hypothetical protein VIH01_14180 [Blastococcus sp.]